MAEEIQQGRIYAGGAYVESSQTGVGLTVPQGWQGAWSLGSEMFVLESANLKANIFMTFQQGDEVGLKALMSNTIPLDPTIQLLPASPPKKTGKVYTANCTVDGASQLSAYIAAQILPPSMGVAFIALSADASKKRQVEQITLKLANSLTVKPPAAPSMANNSSANSDGGLWKEYFKGRYIVRFGVGSLSEISTPVGADYSTSGAGGERWVYYRVLLDKKPYLDGKKWLSDKNEVCD